MSLFSRLSATAALIVFAVTTAHAAPSKAVGAKTGVQKTAATSANGIETVSVEDTPAKTAATMDATTTLNTNTTQPNSTSTASLPSAIENASPRTVFGEFYTQTYHKLTDLNSGTGSPKLDSYAGLKFDLGNARSLSLRQNFDYTGVTDASGANTFHIQDLAINYADGKLATILGDGSLTIVGRLYVPVGENSRNNGNMGAERVVLIGSKSYGKMDLSYSVLGQYSNVTRDSFMGADGKEAANREGLVTHSFDAFYNISDKLAVGGSVGQEFLFFRSLGSSRRFNSDVYIEPTLQYSPVKGLTFQAALYNEINTDQPSQDFALARKDELSAFFNMSASL